MAAYDLAQRILTGDLDLARVTHVIANTLLPVFGLATMTNRTHIHIFRSILLVEAYAYADTAHAHSYLYSITPNVYVAQSILREDQPSWALLATGAIRQLEPLENLSLSLMEAALDLLQASRPPRLQNTLRRIEATRERLIEAIADYQEQGGFMESSDFVTDEELGLTDDDVMQEEEQFEYSENTMARDTAGSSYYDEYEN